MGISLNYRIDMEQPMRALAALRHVDRTPLAEDIGEYFLEQTLLNFQNERAPDGTAWTPSQRAEAEGGKTLVDFAHLRDSITYIASNSGVEVGSNMVYAAIHQFGGEAGRRRAVTIEARPYLGVTPADETAINSMVIDFYRDVLNGH